MNYKIWKRIKIKRIRVPDILCVNCGVRIESRAKTSLEISMSHSLSDPERGWDYGLDDKDFVALVQCEKSGNRPIDWKADDNVQYVAVKNLRRAAKRNKVVFVKPKGAQEGFEARINWPAAVASSDGVVKKITKEGIQFSRQSDGRTITLRLLQKGKRMKPLVKRSQTISRNQVVASVVPVSNTFPYQTVNQDHYLANLASFSLSERYAAAKALSLFQSPDVTRALTEKLKDGSEHIYVKLETAATLARFGNADGYQFISNCLKDTYLQNVLEAVIVLAEISTYESCKLLCEVLQEESCDPEIRAGAAWGLGELNNKVALNALVTSFASVDESIRIEAARALAKLTAIFSPDIVEQFRKSPPQHRPGIAWALAKSASVTLDDLLNSLADQDSRQWISYIVGVHGQQRYIAEIEKLRGRDPEVYFAVTVLWKIMTSWIYDLNEY